MLIAAKLVPLIQESALEHHRLLYAADPIDTLKKMSLTIRRLTLVPGQRVAGSHGKWPKFES
jgi:hypothetical protein